MGLRGAVCVDTARWVWLRLGGGGCGGGGYCDGGYGGGVFSPVMDNPTHHFHQWVARKLKAA